MMSLEAHRIIINAINKGSKGSFLMIADVGTTTALGNLGVHHKRIPKWVLPDSMLALHMDAPNTAELRSKLRPDIMLVELQEHEHAAYQPADNNMTQNILSSSVMTNDRLINDARLSRGRPRKIWVVEGGNCADTRYKEKLAVKIEQHEQLVGMLRTYGYDVQVRPMLLGNAGAI